MVSDVTTSPIETLAGSLRGRDRALVGVVAVAAALGFSELASGLLTPIPSLTSGIATFVIDNVPTPIKEWAIETFGTADKLVLGLGIIVVALGLGAVIGRLGDLTRYLVFGGFGFLAALAAARSPQVGIVWSLIAGALAATVGLGVFRFFAPSTDKMADLQTSERPDRRRFLLSAGAIGGLAVLGGVFGVMLGERSRRALSGRAEVVLPVPAEPVGAPVAANSFDVPGLTPIVVPNADFYRIDTVPVSVPQVDITDWTLRVSGMVDREVTIDFDTLLNMPMVERYVTLSCVSNEVGGSLVGNAKWLGVPLADVLNEAGVSPSAEQIVGRSVDGFTVGFPVEIPFDGRDALIAVGMNGEPLPSEHGYPARLVVAGLYGYVSATKWLSEIELTTWDGFDAYWIPRGWSKLGPVKTQSRIDTPRPSQPPTGGATVTFAGVAWAPDRGISRVELSIDGGEFQEAILSEALSDSAWIQWTMDWEAVAGAHTAQVRATDGNGDVQTEEIARPAPDGASGYHTISFDVA